MNPWESQMSEELETENCKFSQMKDICNIVYLYVDNVIINVINIRTIRANIREVNKRMKRIRAEMYHNWADTFIQCTIFKQYSLNYSILVFSLLQLLVNFLNWFWSLLIATKIIITNHTHLRIINFTIIAALSRLSCRCCYYFLIIFV